MADRQRGSVRGCHLLCSNTSCGKPSLYFVLMDLQPSIYPHTHPSSLSPTHQPTHSRTDPHSIPGTNHQAPNLSWGSRQGCTHPGGCKEGDVGTSICMNLSSSHYYYFIKHFLLLFLVVLGLCCCMWAFSSCSDQRLLSSCRAQASHCGGFSSDCGGNILPMLQSMGFRAPRLQ